MDPETRILVVDDDPALCWTTTRILSRAGYSVESAETGEAGLRLAREQKPALALLDVVLPGIDGLEVCRRIKADPDLSSIYVLLLSSHRIDTLEQAAGLEIGADGYIVRPVSNRELLARVEAILRLKRAEDDLRARTQELAQRVREIDCLYAIAHLFEQDLPLDAKLEAVARLLPRAWPESEIACARVTLDGIHYPRLGCSDSPWKLVAPLRIGGVEVGCVQLSYYEDRPFAPEHHKLLATVAEQVARMIDQARVAEALQWSEERFRGLFHQTHEGISLTDPQGMLIEWNQAMEHITGLSAASVVGRPVWDVEIEVDPGGGTASERREAVRAAILHALETGRAHWLTQPREREYRRPDGSVRILSASFFRVETGRGFLLGNVVRDVTERCEAEAALAREAAINAAMAELKRAMIRTDSIDDISNLVVDHARRLTASAYGFAAYIEPGRGGLVVHDAMGESRDGSQAGEGEVAFRHLAALTGWVIEHQQPLLTNTPGADPRSSATPASHFPVQRFLAVPAVVSDVLMGEIALVNAAHDYTELDRELVERLASLYAVAIQRSRTEQALRDSELRFRSLLESAPDAILLVDAQGRIVFANVQAEESLGYERAELLGQPVELLIPESVREKHRQDRMAEASGVPERLMSALPALPVRRKDGSCFSVDVKLSPLRMEGEPLVTIMLHDVTEQEEARAALLRAHEELESRVVARTAELAEANRDLHAEIAHRQDAEQALRASEARFRQIAAHIDEALWMTDVETGDLIYVSPVFEQMAGLALEEMPTDPRPLMAEVHPDDRERVAQALANKQTGYDLECRVQRDAGALRWVRIRSFPIRDQAGRVYRIAGLAQDVTAEREAQATMIQNERLAMAGRLAASLAHEINNPLQSAIGCLSLVQESLAAGDDAGHLLSVVEDELERTARIVTQLRSLSRPSALRHREWVNLNALLDQVLILAQKQLSSSGVRVARNLDPDLPAVMASPDEMRQVLLNLVLNAVDAMPVGGVLEVTTARAEPDGVIVRLVDTGGGMTRETLHQLFDPFYTTKPDGLGLGLFISQNIVRAHGGSISAESGVGEGAALGVWLPLEPPQQDGEETDDPGDG